MRAGDKAWIALGAGVLLWDAACPKNEMLSDASQRYTTARPILSRTIIVYTAGHLMHVWPPWADLFTIAAKAFDR